MMVTFTYEIMRARQVHTDSTGRPVYDLQPREVELRAEVEKLSDGEYHIIYSDLDALRVIAFSVAEQTGVNEAAAEAFEVAS